MTESARGSRSGCLMLLWAVLLGLSVIIGGVVLFFVLNDADDQTSADVTTGPPPTDTVAAPGCTDVSEEFRRAAAGPGVEYVRGVCWETSGQLRAEIDLAADVNADSPPARGLCVALTGFITASGRAWHGFTGYSTSPLTPGQAMLTRAQPDQPCQNPAQR